MSIPASTRIPRRGHGDSSTLMAEAGHAGRRAAATQHRTGLLQVVLSCEGRQRRHYVHRLMREAFDDT